MSKSHSAPNDDARAHHGTGEPILHPSEHPKLVLTIAVTVIVAITAGGFVLDFTEPDLALAVAINHAHVGWFGRLASAVYRLLEPGPAITITVAATGIIWWARKDIRPAAAFAGVVAVTWVPSDAIKLLVGRPRPPLAELADPYSPFQTDSSYPSGHVVFVTAFLIALAMLLGHSRRRTVIRWLTPILVIAVAIALTVDAVHYPTDVLASIAWSIAVAPAARLIWVDHIMANIPWLRPN